VTELLTRVALVSIPGQVNVYLRFGSPARTLQKGRHQRYAYFAPGNVFCRVWWQGNRYGTTRWQVVVLQAKAPGELMQTVPGIAPGATLSLSVDGEPRVRSVLRLISAIEARGVALTDVASSYWQVTHNRLASRADPAFYGSDRHAAELMRCRLR